MIDVGRMTLHVTDVSEAEAERLGRAVAEALLGWPPPQRPIALEHVQATVETPRRPGESVDSLAGRIAASALAAALREAGA
jgi:hypothetical protein